MTKKGRLVHQVLLQMFRGDLLASMMLMQLPLLGSVSRAPLPCPTLISWYIHCVLLCLGKASDHLLF